MKKIFLIISVAVGLLFTTPTHAQVSLNISIGDQPAWAPEGSDNARYYYLPDMDMYYDVPAHQFLYMQNKRWVRTSTLPASYRHYDLYKIHKVALTDNNAYKNHSNDKKEYAEFKGKYDQHPIRDSHDDKYSNNKNNWKNNKYHKSPERH